LLRLNTRGGKSQNLSIDGATWAALDDPSVDVAVIPFALSMSSPFDFRYLPFERMSADPLIKAGEVGIGIGELTYTVGLLRLMSGAMRNLPVVHFGSIAMVPDERIPVQDWREPNKVLEVEG
jgi:hypothetical protein